jgi:hypothetical protein
VLVCAIAIRASAADQRVNPDTVLIAQFEQRINDYMALHRKEEAGLQPLKPTTSAAKIARHQEHLAHEIREHRPGARQGDIFTPSIAAEFTRLIQIAYSAASSSIRASLASDAPHHRRLKVNEGYPDGEPLSASPPSLLLNLPSLPAELEYHIVGRDLVLLDTNADLVVDYIPNAIPGLTKGHASKG